RIPKIAVMIKYTILAYAIISFLFFYEMGLAVNAKTVLEKKVKGISTQIKQVDDYQKEVSNFNEGY
ncbi:MAG TPA: hypothetical protein VES68_03160, partial [Candidatus Sulfotelmatobacter sp.]|nr:hypothetical protein [Candidatus Sulfotelmatobacter sp.]